MIDIMIAVLTVVIAAFSYKLIRSSDELNRSVHRLSMSVRRLDVRLTLHDLSDARRLGEITPEFYRSEVEKIKRDNPNLGWFDTRGPIRRV